MTNADPNRPELQRHVVRTYPQAPSQLSLSDHLSGDDKEITWHTVPQQEHRALG